MPLRATTHNDAKHCCAYCGTPFRHQDNGRPRKYCSNRCRSSAHRARDAIRWSNECLRVIEAMRLCLVADDSIDWSDEDHRVA